MNKDKLEVVKNVIQTSHLTNKMVAEAFGFSSADALNVEFLNTFGMSVAEFRERCKSSPPAEEDTQSHTG
ncbi:MAG: hypothetical protein R3309_06710 [Reinekea sp.]|nr:hypothetical protein [Reinekea sp.]MDX1473843.1 hypothetical protein [Reinekea sp.]